MLERAQQLRTGDSVMTGTGYAVMTVVFVYDRASTLITKEDRNEAATRNDGSSDRRDVGAEWSGMER